jgi:hypothetical protein
VDPWCSFNSSPNEENLEYSLAISQFTRWRWQKPHRVRLCPNDPHRFPTFRSKFHPLAQNRSTLQLIYHQETDVMVIALNLRRNSLQSSNVAVNVRSSQNLHSLDRSRSGRFQGPMEIRHTAFLLKMVCLYEMRKARGSGVEH